MRSDSLAGSSYAGLFLMSLATLTYEILLTRIFSVTMYYHFAFVAISVAMFGMSVGAVVVYLFPAWFTAERTQRHAAIGGLLFALTSLGSFAAHLLFESRRSSPDLALGSMAPTYLAASVPFVFSGISTCLLLTRFPGHVGRLYAADLAGAAIGCVAFVQLIRITDGPTMVIVVAFIGAVAAVLFAVAGRHRGMARAASACAVLLGIFAAVNSVAFRQRSPLLGLSHVKGRAEGHVLYERWNSFSRVTVEGDPDALWQPSGWGLSPAYPADRPVRELNLWIDSAAGTTLTRYTGQPAEIEHLKYDIVNLAHYLRSDADVLAVGAGGERDLLSAIAFGQKRVTGVEINENILRAVNGVFGDFTGHLDRDPRVTLINDEARSFLAGQRRTFDIIQVSLIDTWAATAAGAFALTENSIYTVEAFRTFLGHLAGDGILTITRWYLAGRPSEIYRLTSLASASLRQSGAANPRGHMIIARTLRRTSGDEYPDGVGTLLVGRSPFTPQDLARIEDVARRLQFDLVLTPRATMDPLLAKIADGDDSDPQVAGYPLNITAPTDDSPFFFHMLKFRDAFDRSRRSEWERGANRAQVNAVYSLASLLVVVLALTFLCILGPLALTARRESPRAMGPWLAYFGGIGMGYMLVEISQLQRLIILLGHPTYALTVVLFTLLVSSGLGSLITQRIGATRIRGAGPLVLGVLLMALIASGLVTPAASRLLEGGTASVRIAGAGGILFGLGLFMGMPFPIGMRLAARSSTSHTSWLWGINGAGSVLASVLAVVIAMSLGISTAYWIGTGFYAIAIGAFALAIRHHRDTRATLTEGRTR